MSERLPKIDNLCTNPENHKLHMCELRLSGRTAELAKYSDKPAFICGNCATKANAMGALCAPGPIDEN